MPRRPLVAALVALAALVPTRPAAVEAAPDRFAGYSLPVNLARLSNASAFKAHGGEPAAVPLGPAARALLTRNGFVVTPADWQRFDQAYEAGRYESVPVFITSDSILNVYHLTFDKLLRDLERERFAPALVALDRGLVAAAEQQLAGAKGTALEAAATKLLAYLSVGLRLVDPAATIPVAVGATVREEVRLIAAHGGLARSPLTGQLEDYGQYVPRGHYTRSKALENYFRAMMWHGRVTFRLKDASETRVALLLTRLLRTVPGAAARWSSVYEPTALLVGRSDDLGFLEYGPLMDRVYGANAGLTALADPAKLTAFIAAARGLPAPKVNSLAVRFDQDKAEATQGFRFMGQRFVLDAYIFGELLWRNVGTLEQPRVLPKGLDVFAALGSAEAAALLKAGGESRFANYDTQLRQVRAAVAALGPTDWTGTLYANWLYTLQAVVAPQGASVPPFMRTTAWTRKQLQTALGSWTELKHDTVLYAKQVMVEMGGGDEPEYPRGYVEPVPLVYSRLLDLVRRTKAQLSGHGLLSARTSDSLAELGSMLGFLGSVTGRELSGGKITRDEYDRIHFYGGWLEKMVIASTDSENGSGESGNVLGEDEATALVTDVATEPGGKVLQEAIGRVFELLAVVPDGHGGLQVSRGATYSHYEFVGSTGDRLTDAQWRKTVNAGKQPAQASWTGAFIAR